MSEAGPRKPPQDQSSGSGRTVTTSRHPYITDPIASKHVCFYKSGDPQFSGLHMVINNRTFKTFDALLDSLSKKVPLPFGVRNITTPRGVHAVHTLDELVDGKAYICSDQRKVKPINLAVASKKLLPWYHVRPISARRRALQLAKQNAGRPVRKNTPVIVRTPKRLMVFRNGDPSVKHNLMLQKRTTPTFEALLDYVSELMHFPVVKLHTPDGRRVDGLPALILCSGIVVAAGREAFKPSNYKTQKSSRPTWLPAKRMASKRLKRPASLKKKSVSSGKSRLFSPSSERYFVNQIHHSIVESQRDLPSTNTGSEELGAAHLLESVVETDGDTYQGDGGERATDCMPSDDDIEKSFRVNQDGSMTVEMKVRLTIKEEETIHWTTTVTRSSVDNQLSMASVAEPELENFSPESKALPPEQPNAAGPVNGYDSEKKDRRDDDDTSPEASGIISVERDDEENAKAHVGIVSPWRAPTPGPRKYRPKQASLESIQTSSGDEIQEKTVGSYTYRETTENGEMKEEYCMVRQCSSRPIPKPRRVGSMHNNNYSKTQSTLKSGMAEILQIRNGEEEVRERVMHLYEQQTCQDNFLANRQFTVQGVSMYGQMYGRPATSDTTHFSSSNDHELELGRPSTTSESISVCRADRSLSSDFTIPAFKAERFLQNNSVLNVQIPPLSKPTKDNETSGWVSKASKNNSTNKGMNEVKRFTSKPKLKNQVLKNKNPDKRHEEDKANASNNNKKVKTGGFRSNSSIRKIYGPKLSRSLNVQKKIKGKEIKLNTENPKESLVKKLNDEKENSFSLLKNVLHVTFPTEIQVKGTLKRQRSMHEEKRIEKEVHNLSTSMSLPALSSSSSNITEYVENWLEKALPTVYPEPVEDTGYLETPRSQAETEGNVVQDVSEISCEMDIEEEKSCVLKQNMEITISSFCEKNELANRTFANTATQTNLTLENTTLQRSSDLSLKAPLHIDAAQKNLPPNPSVEKILISRGLPVHPSVILAEKPSICENPSLENPSIPMKVSVEKPSIINGLSSENKSVPNSSLIEKNQVSNNLSSEKMALPATTQTEKAPLSSKVLNVTSVASSPSYFMYSTPSSLGDKEQHLSIRPSSDEASTATGHVFEKTTLFNHSTLKEPLFPKQQKTKKTRLVSNLSLEKQLSLRKASVEKSSISSDATVENLLVGMTSISHCHSSEKTSLPATTQIETKPPSTKVFDVASLASSPSCFMSASPTSLTSEERPLSISPSSEDAPTPTGHILEKTTLFNHSILKEPSSPKRPVKKTRLVSNLSLEQQLSLRKESVEKSALASSPTLVKSPNPVKISEEQILHNRPFLEDTSPSNESSIPKDYTLEKNRFPSSPRQGRTPLPRNHSLKLQNVSPERTTIPTTLMTRKTSASSYLSSQTPVPHKRTMKNRLLRYSQSLEIVSPPISLKSKKELISRNHSLESKPPPVSPTLKRSPLPRKSRQTPLMPKSMPIHLDSSTENTAILSGSTSVTHEDKNDNKWGNSTKGDNANVTAEWLLTKTLMPSHRNKLPSQPDMKPILEKLCFSIQSIRQITNNNRPSCLEKSNSLPDFSSHVASTFGSSSKALLAFLSVITLKESFSNWNIPELHANSVSCAEALKMMESLREIASIEDAEELKHSLSELQKSTSTQLLRSWKGFQDLNNKVRSRSSTPNSSEQNLLFETCPVDATHIEQKTLGIDELINEIDMPEKLKEVLAALPPRVSKRIEVDEIEMSKESNEKTQSSSEESVNANSAAVHKEEAGIENVVNNEVNVNVKSIIKRLTNIHHPKEVAKNKMSQIMESPTSTQEHCFFLEEQSLKEDYICHRNCQAENKDISEIVLENWEESEAKCRDKQIDRNEEQTSSEKEHTYSLALHDGYLNKPTCPVEAKDKDGILSSLLEENLKEKQKYYIEHVEQEVKCMEVQVGSDGETTAQDQASSEEDLKLHNAKRTNQYEKPTAKCAVLKVSSEEEECLLEEPEYYIENTYLRVSKCGEVQLSNDDIDSSAEPDQASPKHHEEPVVRCVELIDSEKECFAREQKYNIENLPCQKEYKVKSMELQLSCKGSLKEDQVCSEEEECLVEDPLSNVVSEKHMEEECLEEVQQCHIGSRSSCVRLLDSYEVREFSTEEQATSEEKLERHTKDQPSHREPEDLQGVSKEERSAPKDDQASSEEELEGCVMSQLNHKEVKSMDTNVRSEDSMSSPEKEQASSDEVLECHIDNYPIHERGVKYTEMQVCREETEYTNEEDEASFKEEEESHAVFLSYADADINVESEQTHLWIKQTSQIQSTVIEMLPSLIKPHSSADWVEKDSGKDSEQNASFEQFSDIDGNRCSSEEQQVNYGEKLSSSEEEHFGLDYEPYPEEERFGEYQEILIEEEEPSKEDENYEKSEAKSISHFEEALPSVAERVNLLAKKIANVEERQSKSTETTGMKMFAHIEVPAVSDGDDLINLSHLSNEQAELDNFIEDTSDVHTSCHVMKDVNKQDNIPVNTCCKRTRWPVNTSETVAPSLPALSSSLAFSYDGCITHESEGNRVKSIKEMFMAKSVVDLQYGQTSLPRTKDSDLSYNRPGSSDSGAHQLPTSTKMSGSEDDSVKKSITKGFVRRTIESLYGKKDTKNSVSESQRVSLPKTREFIGKVSLSPFHNAQSKVVSDVSYFNATSSFVTYTEPTRCIAFNAKVGPGDSVPIDKNRWLLRESVIRKSVSEPIDINKNTSASIEDLRKDTKEDIPYSLFGQADLENTVKSVTPLVPKCTYFNLPHGCDSDPHQDDLSKDSDKDDVSKSVVEVEEPKLRSEKNGTLPAFAPTDFTRSDNKVHPLIECPGEGKVVLVQPGKCQPAKGQNDVKKIPKEPDALEMLYFSCGQHCPIL